MTHVDEWICTRGEMFHAVATADQPMSALSPELDVVILSGYHEFRPVERRAIERIVDELPMVALLPLHQDGRTRVDAVATDALNTYESLDFETVELESDDDADRGFEAVTNALYRPEPDAIPVPDALRWRELPTPEREIRFVARELRTELASGRDPDDLAVVIPGTEAYSGYVDDTFDTFDIPHVTTAATQLNRTFTGSVVHDLLSLAESDPRAEDLTSLPANPLIDVIDVDQVNAITAAARRRDTVSLLPLLSDIDDGAEALIDDLLAKLETLQMGGVRDATVTLRRLLDDQFDVETATKSYASGTERAIEERAYDLVDEVLSSFESLEAVSSDLSPLALFTRAFDGIPIRVPQSAASGHVEVMGLLDARMQSFEEVFLVGLTGEHFPVTPERPAFFEEMTDTHPRFDTGDERLRGRYLFATLLTNVDALTITTPETGDDESAIVRSPVLDEDDNEPHNKQDGDDEDGWVVDEDVCTDGGTVIGFLDASQPQPYDNSRRVWYVDDPHIERPLVKTEDSVVGFYALNGESLVRFTEDETKERICEVLELVREQNPGKRILLVLDKHGSHLCEYTRKRAHQLGIDFVFLPSGSPHLNPIEQVWKQLKWTMSPIIVQDETEFHELVKDVFEQVTQRVSFANKWAEKFLDFQKIS